MLTIMERCSVYLLILPNIKEYDDYIPQIKVIEIGMQLALNERDNNATTDKGNNDDNRN